MDTPPRDEAQRAHLLLKTPRPHERRLAWAVVLISAALFLLAVPFATEQLAHYPVFTPIWLTSLVISDVVTAVMLYGQYYALRARALLLLAGAYLFTALATLVYAVGFPGLLTPAGLLGGGVQTTPFLYMYWHAGFPLAVMAYALIKRESVELLPVQQQPRARGAILASIGVVMALVLLGTAVAVLGHEALPVVLEGRRVTPTGHRWLFSTWLLSVAALFVLWRCRPHTALDVWLLVVMCVWIFDVALAAVLNAGRYDLGWYAGRAYGFLAACGLLLVLLSEHTRSYVRMVRLSAELHHANQQLLQLSMQDGLTQLANRRAFDKYLQEQMAVNARQGRGLALVLADVDHFKAYNDLYGHHAGDDCLRQVATAMRNCCRRPTDLAARYGGEEFALILPDTSPQGALHVAEAVRAAVQCLEIPHANSGTGSFVSVSLGVAMVQPRPGAAVASLLQAADAALYQAKRRGRNQVVLGDVELAAPAVVPAPQPGIVAV